MMKELLLSVEALFRLSLVGMLEAWGWVKDHV